MSRTIDLETALAELVELAPAPPDAAGVARRARQRRARRRGTTLVAALAVLVCGVAGTIAIRSTHHARRVILQQPPTESVRVTLLDGSQLEISGPKSLGLTKLDPVFNAQLDNPSADTLVAIGHSFTLQRSAPDEPGPVVGRYPTGDGHELVVHSTAQGVDAVVEYPGWTLVVPWNHDPTNWGAFATALSAKETPDGFLVIHPIGAGWQLGPTDAPDVQLGDEASGSGPAFSFFGPSTYPSGCPTEAQATTHTPEGWAVSQANGTWWCDPNATVRIHVGNPALVDTAVQGLRVTFTDAGHTREGITTLGGASFEITAPSSVFDQLVLQAAVYVDGLDKPNLLNETPNLLPVSARRASLPSSVTSPSYTTGDGHELFSYVPPTDCGCEMLAGTYGRWLFEIEVQGMSTEQRTLIASLLAAHITPDGFLALDPVAPMHFGPGPFSDIVLDGVDIVASQYNGCSPPNSVDAHTPEGFGVHIVGSVAGWCDPNAHVSVTTDKTLVDKIRVRRISSPTPF